jgi:hypothetical protein
MPAHDVFICHRGETKRDFSDWLTKELQHHKFTVFLDQLSLRPGAAALATIDAALRAAQVVVAVLSEGFFASRHCVGELRRCRELGKRVVPLFFGVSADGCRPEVLSASPKMAGVDWAEFGGGRSGWDEDVRWIKSVTGRHLREVDGFWSRYIRATVQDVAHLLGRPVPEDLPSQVPFHRNLAFVGRTAELERLKSLLTACRTAYVTGMGRIGKTQLILEYVYASRDRYSKFIWVDGDYKRRAASMLDHAAHLGVPLREGGGADAERENLA